MGSELVTLSIASEEGSVLSEESSGEVSVSWAPEESSRGVTAGTFSTSGEVMSGIISTLSLGSSVSGLSFTSENKI